MQRGSNGVEQSGIGRHGVARCAGAACGFCVRRVCLGLLATTMLVLVLAAPSMAAAPAWELVTNHGPTNVAQIPQNVNAVQTLTVSSTKPKSKYLLEFEAPNNELGEAEVAVDDTAEKLQKKLEAMESIGKGNVIVTGGPGDEGGTKPYVIEFVGELGKRPVNLIEAGPPENAVEETGTTVVAMTRPGSHDVVQYRLLARNLGGVATSGTVKVIDKLPPGLTTASTPEGPGWTCTPAGVGKTEVTCTSTEPVNPDSPAEPVDIEAEVPTNLAQKTQLVNTAVISGGGVGTPVGSEDVAEVNSTPASFGVHGFTAGSFNDKGELDAVAGSHPYAATTSFYFNTITSGNGEVTLPGNLKDTEVVLPEGFIGNPQAVVGAGANEHLCSQKEFTEGLPGGPNGTGATCKPAAQVGSALVYLKAFAGEQAIPKRVGVYDLQPPPGVPAEFGFIFANVPVRIDAHVIREPGANGTYRVTVLSPDINEAYKLFGVSLTLWGVPSSESHKAERFFSNEKPGAPAEGLERPFLTNPSDCVSQAARVAETSIAADTWELPGPYNSQGGAELASPRWKTATYPVPRLMGCGALKFTPTVGFTPATSQADTPSSYAFTLGIPQNEEPAGLGTPPLRSATVTLPEGVSISPSAANGLEACSAAQIGLETTAPGACPPASQIGTVKIHSALLENELTGRLYVGTPSCGPCSSTEVQEGKLFKLYIEAEGSGVRVKLPGTATTNQTTGQLTTTFNTNPQLPFTTLTLTLRGGPRASLANPQACGSGYTSGASLAAWSTAGAGVPGTEVAAPFSEPFSIDWDGAGGACPPTLPLSPGFIARTANSTAGAYSPFNVTFERKDREQDLSAITVTTPPGLLGKIAGIPRCTDAQVAEEHCPEGSRIATATSAAGAGPDPYVVNGPVYLTGPYEGAPFGLAIVVPAKAGPFDLGNVTVRSAININPKTSAITITTKNLPQSKDGVPFRLKTVSVTVNRPEFMFNPTNCEPKAIGSTITGMPIKAGETPATSSPSAPFTASSCASLSFHPTLTATAAGNFTKLKGTSFAVRLEQHPGEAHIRKVQLQLPVSLPSRLETLHEACPDTTFTVNPAACPSRSTVGSATAITPLLAVPLSGPAILVSHAGAAFPDLVFLLQGEGVHIELVGNTDIKKGITYSRFETVPDAPITSFETTFPNGRYSILTGYGNLCAAPLLAPTTIVAQNGLQISQATHVAVTGCPPQVSISRVVVKNGSALVTVKLSKAGTVKIAGPGLRTLIKRGLSVGTHQIRVGLSRAGKAAARSHKKIRVQVTLTAGSQTVTNTATVRA
jgi:uncharacterized repeat protein (TIGR01451 family)